MAAESHAFAGWPLELDPEIFDMYLVGLSAAACTEALITGGLSSGGEMLISGGGASQCVAVATAELSTGYLPSWMSPDSSADDRQIVLQDVQDHYRVIDYLLPYITVPDTFISRRHLPISNLDKYEMIRRYFMLDDTVAGMMLGSKLGKPEVETFQEKAAKFGYAAQAISRFADNIKRIAKYVDVKIEDNLEERQEEKESSGGQVTTPLVPIRKIIEKGFLLPSDLVSKYVALIFSFEHHFQVKSLSFEQARFDEQAAICSALAATMCDETEINLREDIGSCMNRLKNILTDSKIVVELHTLVFGEAPRGRLRQKMHDLATKATAHTSSTSTAAAPAGSGNNESSTAGGFTMASHPSQPDLSSATGGQPMATSSPSSSSPPPTTLQALGVSGVASPSPATPTTTMANVIPSSGGGGNGFSRRLADAFPVFLKSWAKVSGNFGSKKDVAVLVDSLKQKVLDPFLWSTPETHHLAGHLHLPGGSGGSSGAVSDPSFANGATNAASSPLGGTLNGTLGGSSSGGVEGGSGGLTPLEIKVKSLRDLANLVRSIGVHFPSLHLVSAQDHKLLDSFFVGYCMVLQLMLQLQLAKLTESSLPKSGSIQAANTWSQHQQHHHHQQILHSSGGAGVSPSIPNAPSSTSFSAAGVEGQTPQSVSPPPGPIGPGLVAGFSSARQTPIPVTPTSQIKAADFPLSVVGGSSTTVKSMGGGTTSVSYTTSRSRRHSVASGLSPAPSVGTVGDTDLKPHSPV